MKLRRLAAVVLIAAAALSLCGCASMYEKEYVSVEDYIPAQPQQPQHDDRVNIRNFTALKQTIQKMVNDGSDGGSLIFGQEYEGDPAADLSNACWQVRTDNALCAYCVQNIAYELGQVMTNYEAKISISYAENAAPVDEIVRMPYYTGIEEALENALTQSEPRLVLLIANSSYTVSAMDSYLSRLYRDDPRMSPCEPGFSVTMYSGSGLQRLYEIDINYRLEAQELESRRAKLEEFKLPDSVNGRRLSQGEKVFELTKLLSAAIEPADSGSSVYDALVTGKANSEGAALALVYLCRELGLECRAVYGQKNWQDYCWNIVKIDGDYYHIDLNECILTGLEHGFLRNDQQMWGSYRWDTSSYNSCRGSLSYADFAENA